MQHGGQSIYKELLITVDIVQTVVLSAADSLHLRSSCYGIAQITRWKLAKMTII